MKNHFGEFDESVLKALRDAYNPDANSFAESYDFKTCQRSDGTTYGTSGDCAQKGSKEVKKSSTKSSWDPGDNLAGTMGTEVAKTAFGGKFKGLLNKPKSSSKGLLGNIIAANTEKERKKAEQKKRAQQDAEKKRKAAEKKAKAEADKKKAAEKKPLT